MSGRSGAGVVAAILVLTVCVVGVARVSHRDTVTCTVESKDRAANRDGKTSMRVYTRDCGVFEVGDELAVGAFDSADRYAALQPGRRYNLTVVGWRVQLFSWFPNIIEAREVRS